MEIAVVKVESWKVSIILWKLKMIKDSNNGRNSTVEVATIEVASIEIATMEDSIIWKLAMMEDSIMEVSNNGRNSTIASCNDGKFNYGNCNDRNWIDRNCHDGRFSYVEIVAMMEDSINEDFEQWKLENSIIANDLIIYLVLTKNYLIEWMIDEKRK